MSDDIGGSVGLNRYLALALPMAHGLVHFLVPRISGFRGASVWVAHASHHYSLAYSSIEGVDQAAVATVLRRHGLSRVTAGLPRLSPQLQDPVQMTIAIGQLSLIPIPSQDRLQPGLLLELLTDPGSLTIRPDDVIESAARFLRLRREIREATAPDPAGYSASVHEAHLLDAFVHELKGGVGGEATTSAHVFIYEARDRLLYHRATDRLPLRVVSRYEPPHQATNPRLLDFVKETMRRSGSLTSATRARLESALSTLSDRTSIRALKEGDSGVGDLRALLPFLPQEPGTGVAGRAAATLVPEFSLPGFEPRWSPANYEEHWFSLMLAVEQLFGIANGGGSMAAVPLLEAGMLAGVLFVNQESGGRARESVPWLLRAATQLAPLLSMYRTQNLHRELLRIAGEHPKASIGTILSEALPLGLNARLTLCWHPSGKDFPTVSMWAFDRPPSRYALLMERYSAVKEPWRGVKTAITAQLRRLAAEQDPASRLRVLPIPLGDDGVFTSSFDLALPRQLRSMAAGVDFSALRTTALWKLPSSGEILAIYLDEAPDVIEVNQSSIAGRLELADMLERARASSESRSVELVGDSEAFVAFLNQVDSFIESTKTPKEGLHVLLVLGDTGSGKSEVAGYIHRHMGLRGELVEFNVMNLKPGEERAALFGTNKNRFTAVKESTTSPFELAKDGVLLIDEFHGLSSDAQRSMNEVVTRGKLVRWGDDATAAVTVNPVVVYATLKSSEDLLAGAHDAIYRVQKAIQVPSVVDRRADVLQIVRHALASKGIEHVHFTPEAAVALANARWPRNVGSILNFAHDAATSLRTTSGIREVGYDMVAEAAKGPLPYLHLDENGPWTTMDISEHISLTGRGQVSGRIFTTPNVYEPFSNAEESWTRLTCRAFAVLERHQRRTPWGTYWSVGCGPGADAVAAARILRLARVLLSDYSRDAACVARESLTLNTTPGEIEISVFSSDICVPRSDRDHQGRMADIIFENLPNIPAAYFGSPTGPVGRELGSYIPRRRDLYRISDDFASYLLESHHNFLNQARTRLNYHGVVVSAIGGRSPWPTVASMFNESGFEPDILVLDIKEQEEPIDVIGGYARHEGAGAGPFVFFPLDAMRELLRSKFAYDSLAGWRAPPEEVFSAASAAGLVLSAKQAANEHQNGTKIGHFVFMVAGWPKGASES